MVALDISETSKSLALGGGYAVFNGLISNWYKEHLFLSEALVAFCIGIAFGPKGANVFSPIEWVDHDHHSLDYLSFQVSRIVMALQVMFTGINLPKRYVSQRKMSLFMLLIGVMTSAWFVVGLLIWGLIPGLSFVEALVVGSILTPTDPVLSNSICKGPFAEKYVPVEVRNIILAEAGANDGLGFPFLFMPLYLILRHEPTHPVHTVGGVVGEWFYNIVLYQIALACIVGTIVGYLGRRALKFCRERHYVDHEGFVGFSVGLTFGTLGVMGLLGSDDILCCFVVGNSFNWDGYFGGENEDQAFQEVMDGFLNTIIFVYIGSIMPWEGMSSSYGTDPWRLVVLGILVILLRRLPWVLALSPWISSLETLKDKLFTGYFGPMGVGAMFYAQLAMEKLPNNGNRQHLRDVLQPTVYFIIMTSIVVHGLTITVGKGAMDGLTKVGAIGHKDEKQDTPSVDKNELDLHPVTVTVSAPRADV